MRIPNGVPRGAAATLVALLAGLSIAACGGSSNGSSSGSSNKSASSKNASATTTTGGSGSGGAAASAFTSCLKSHGVTLPKGGPGGFRGGFRGGANGRTGTNAAPPIGTAPRGGYPGGGYPGGGGRNGGGYPGGGRPNGGGFAGGNSKFAKAFQACRSKLPKGSFGQGGRFGGRPGGRGGLGGGPQFSATVLKSYVSCIRKNGYPQMPEPKASSNGAGVFPSSVSKSAKFRTANAKCEGILRSAFRRGPGPPRTSITSTTSST